LRTELNTVNQTLSLTGLMSCIQLRCLASLTPLMPSQYCRIHLCTHLPNFFSMNISQPVPNMFNLKTQRVVPGPPYELAPKPESEFPKSSLKSCSLGCL
jgi:hypothetical protein